MNQIEGEDHPCWETFIKWENEINDKLPYKNLSGAPLEDIKNISKGLNGDGKNPNVLPKKLIAPESGGYGRE